MRNKANNDLPPNSIRDSMMAILARRHSVIPGFNITLGYTLLYLGLIVIIPLAAAFVKTASLTWPAFWETVTSPRVLASYRLTFGASLLAAFVNVFFGFI